MLLLFSGQYFVSCLLLDLKSKEGNITIAFHAHLDKGESVFVEMHFGFKKQDLEAQENSHSLCFVLCAFRKYFVEKLKSCVITQSKLGLCLFVGEKVKCISYVKYLLFWSKDEHISKY